MNVVEYCYNHNLDTYVFVVKEKETNTPIIKKYDKDYYKTLNDLRTIWNCHLVKRVDDDTLN